MAYDPYISKRKGLANGPGPQFTSPITAGQSNAYQAPATMQQQAGAPEQTSGRFVNFDRMLGLNKEKAAGMTNAIANPIEKEGAAVSSGINQERGQFGNEVSRGSQGTQYNGPASITQSGGYQGLKAGAENVARGLGALGSAGGVQSLLQKQNNYGGYGSGASRLDTGLVQGSGGSRFRDLQSRYGGLGDALSGAVSQSEQLAKDTKTDLEGAALRKSASDKLANEDKVKQQIDQSRANDASMSSSQRNDQVQSIGDEKYANQYGLTLEQWVRAGRPDLRTLKKSDIDAMRGS